MAPIERKNFKDQDVVEISANVAAAIVRSNVVPKILSGVGTFDGTPAVAEIGKEDLVDMVKNNTLPKGVRIDGGTT